jgi:hypothetical protein
MFRAYGTTALGVLVAAGWVRALAIGDGDIGCVERGGRHRSLCPSPASIGVQTESVAAPDAVTALRVDAWPSAEVIAAWACTDGFSTAQVEPRWRQLVATQLRSMLDTRTCKQIADGLDEWLQPAAGVGDDTTMVLALRTEDRTSAQGSVPAVLSESAQATLAAPTIPPAVTQTAGPLWPGL